MQTLSGRTALVTGANRGIGLAVSKALAQAGATVVLAARNPGALEKARAEIAAAGGKADVCVLDLENEASVRKATDALKSKLRSLDILVANGASLGARLPLVRYPLDVWRHTFRVNVEANLQLLAELDPLLQASEAPRVIMLSAKVATSGKATTGSYAASKAALESLVRIYIAEHKDSRIRVNILSPGPTRTEMRARAEPKEDPMSIKAPEALGPLFVELASPSCTQQGAWIDADQWLAARK